MSVILSLNKSTSFYEAQDGTRGMGFHGKAHPMMLTTKTYGIHLKTFPTAIIKTFGGLLN